MDRSFDNKLADNLHSFWKVNKYALTRAERLALVKTIQTVENRAGICRVPPGSGKILEPCYE